MSASDASYEEAMAGWKSSIQRLTLTREALLLLAELVADATDATDHTPKLDAFMAWVMAVYEWNPDEIEQARKRWKAIRDF